MPGAPLFLWLVCSALGSHAAPPPEVTPPTFDRDEALAVSQGAIGGSVGNHSFYTTEGQRRELSHYAGRPLVISLVFTSCPHICPATTQHLADVVRKARSALGEDSFSVITVGFDTPNDTADAMRSFARKQSVDIDGWDFLATDEPTIQALSAELGFLYYPTPSGFDHLIQSSVVDAQGVVTRQVYGIRFDTPHLIEPLKALVFGEDVSASFLDQLTSRVRLFCTVYDPASDSYRFDYSIFVGLAMGLCLGVVCIYLLWREWSTHLTHTRSSETR
jgi:protein SCO1/2